MFSQADLDGGGEIEFAEFKGLFANLDTPVTLLRLEKILDKLAGQKEPQTVEVEITKHERTP